MYGSNDNFETVWFQTNANKLATTRARQAIDQSGSSLPCKVMSVSGSLVTVNFECTFTVYQNGEPIQATLPPLVLPKAEAQWCRLPTQPGDFGVTMPADTFLGAVAGTGSGVASLDTDYGNMGNLVWVPIGNTAFATPPQANSPWLNGPAGAVVSDTNQTVVSIYDATGKAISHIVPISGGLLGLGALASTLSSTRAVPAYADLDSLMTGSSGVVQQTLVKLIAAVGTAIGGASSNWATAQAALAAAFAEASFVTGISGIYPTIPSCSSIVRVSA